MSQEVRRPPRLQLHPHLRAQLDIRRQLRIGVLLQSRPHRSLPFVYVRTDVHVRALARDAVARRVRARSLL